MMADARALLDVLFASLWQGACVAAAAAALLALAGRRSNAATRHMVLECALLAVAVVPVATTLPYLQTHAVSISHGVSQASPDAGRALAPAFLDRRIDVVLSDRLVIGLVCAWAAGVLFFALRVAAGSRRLARLVRRSRLLGDRDGVPVLVSADVALPLAVGFAAPSVIMPASLAVPSGVEFECALLHELAHVRRRDAWTNALDRVLHAFLFFNPAALVMLRRIAFEREAACDDVAAAASRDAGEYARSLAALAVAWARKRQPAAFGALGFACPTVERIERLQRCGRNASTTVSRFAVGGFATMLVLIAFALQALAPAVAFSAPAAGAADAVAATTCTAGVTVVNPAEPKLPSGAPKVTHRTTAEIAVRVSASGSVAGATVHSSSGRADLDRATLEAATHSTYSPAKRDCAAVAGSYLFVATYAPDHG